MVKNEKPSKEEHAIAKWMRAQVPKKKTKFLNHTVEYFTASKAIDALLQDSPWSKPLKGQETALFTSRESIVDYLDLMLQHKFFHRARKIPVSEKELKAKSKKKDKKTIDEKAKSDDDKPKEGEEPAKTKKRKIRLDMHLEQVFVDGLDAYVWIYDPIPYYYWIAGLLVVLGTVAICLFPLWPSTVRKGVYYLSVAAAGFLILILGLVVIRFVLFCLIWLFTLGKHHLWLLPNLTEDVGFLASFWPLYKYEYKGPVKPKAKNSDDEEEDDKSEHDEKTGSESESESQKSQTGKDFEIIEKEENEQKDS
uniref:Translocation protein SEC62 n=1 Tax=Lynceus sp. MCZ IZ 141354 TaxID=1930659 RepID=A0A9N6WRI4_9CRUS|nr:EOG090X0D00 [Lynceus sp. MCZ IZ 141354]